MCKQTHRPSFLSEFEGPHESLRFEARREMTSSWTPPTSASRSDTDPRRAAVPRCLGASVPRCLGVCCTRRPRSRSATTTTTTTTTTPPPPPPPPPPPDPSSPCPPPRRQQCHVTTETEVPVSLFSLFSASETLSHEALWDKTFSLSSGSSRVHPRIYPTPSILKPRRRMAERPGA